jgi:citrate lyase alpha subunit
MNIKKRLEQLEGEQKANATTADSYQRAVLASMSIEDLRLLRSALVDGNAPIAQHIWRQAVDSIGQTSPDAPG